MTGKETDQIIREVVKIGNQAGQIIMDVYGENDFQVQIKDDESPLTIADQRSNEFICQSLEKLTPSIPIISEENQQIAYSIRKSYDYAWLVDPLDGTKEFIKRNGEFTVNIALIYKQRAVGGIVHLPAHRSSYFGVHNMGAYRIHNNSEQRLSVRKFAKEDEGLTIVCSRSHLNEDTKTYIDKYANATLMPKGSALKFTVLAEAQADLYPRLGPTMEWDTAAAHIVLEESGGQLLEWESREPLIYNKEDLLNPYFIAIGSGDVY